MMHDEIRRLHPDEVDAALTLAMETFLEFEAPDYAPRAWPAPSSVGFWPMCAPKTPSFAASP